MYLEDAARAPGCLLCTLTVSRIRRYIDSLLYESVNDVGFRAQWRKARGFCHRHTWMLAEPQDALGSAILYLDLYESYGDALLSRPTGQRCSLCAYEARLLTDALEEMRHRWEDPDFAAAIEQSDGLCLPHLRGIRSRLPSGPTLDVLTTATVRTLRCMPDELRQLIDSFDYRHSSAVEKRVSLAWRRAMEQLVGKVHAQPSNSARS
jgi:hypothetical protein